MPPKTKPAAAPAAPALPEGPSVDIKLSISAVLADVPYTSVHVRVISSWFECFRTEAVGVAGGTQWVELEPPDEEELGAGSVGASASGEGGDKYGDGVFGSPRLRSSVYECSKSSLPVLPMGDPTESNPLSVVHAVVLGCEGLDRIVPLEFLMLDCSKLLLSSGVVHAEMRSSLGFDIAFSVSSTQPLVSKPPTRLRALFLEVASLARYPCNANETVEQSMQHTFIYGDLKFGPVKKNIYARAITKGGSSFSSSCEVCVLISEKAFETFRDSLTSTTFVLETHDEDICRRAFNRRAADRYTELFKKEEGDAAPALAPRAAAMTSKSMSKQQSAVAEPVEPIAPKRTITAAAGPATEKDAFLIECIEKALASASQLCAHGTARFRLEKLLETSPDILRRFQDKRSSIGATKTTPAVATSGKEDTGVSTEGSASSSSSTGKSFLSDPALVFVEDDMLLEVREAKARKPDRWQIPGDLSLKSFLGKQSGIFPVAGATSTSSSGEEEEPGSGSMGVSHKSATSAGTAMGSAVTTGTLSVTGAGRLFKKERPKFERFDSSQTSLSVRVQLYRPSMDMQTILQMETLQHKTLFKDPSAPPPVPMLHPIERKETAEIKKKNAAIEASNKAKAEKLAATAEASVKRVEIATLPIADDTYEEDTGEQLNLDGTTVSEEVLGGEQQLQQQKVVAKGGNKKSVSQPKSPRSTKSSPRPKSALKEEAEVGIVSARGDTATSTSGGDTSKNKDSGTKNPYDRELALEKLLDATPYTRMVFLFKYDNDNMLEALNFALNTVNMRALPNIQGTVRSYSLSAEEEEATNRGELDLVCGFSIIDDDTRMVVLEGLAGYDKGMESIFIDMPRFNVNDTEVKILSNPEVLFPNRIYTEYGPDAKRIRPRDKLKKLVQKPELYDRKQVDAVCFEALEKIMEIRRASDLQSTKTLSMYPSAESLNKMELLYGEAISKGDIDGTRAMRTKRTLKAKQAGGLDQSTITASYGTESEAGGAAVVGASASSRAGDVSAIDNNSTTFQRAMPSRLAATDCWNDLFVERLAQRDFAHPQHNYVMEQRELRRQAWRRGLHKRAERDAEDKATLARLTLKNPELASGVLHGYASQSVNIKDMLLSDTRDRLKDDREATYTYSKDFQSQTLVLVDEYADRLKIQAAHRAKNISKWGFVYPAPKTRDELITHPKKPSSVRIEELHTPFPGEETEYIDSSGGVMLPEIREKNMQLRDMERNFDNKLSGNKLFGMLQPPAYERDFELGAIGDRTKLPRGHLTGGTDQNKGFWRSVHAGGDEGIKLQERIQQEEKDNWKSKMVVDSLDFKVGNFKIKDKAAQWQRHEDMLKDAPQTKAFKHLRTAKNYETFPVAVMTQGGYVQNAATKALQRDENKDQFITTKEIPPGSDAVPKDFVRFINRHTDKPKIQTKVHKLKHPALSHGTVDTVGPKWGDNARTDK